MRDRPERGEEQEILQAESGGLSCPSPHQDDSTQDDAEATKDFWSITGDFNLLPSRGTQSQTEHAERRINSYSVEVHRLHQNHAYIIGCVIGKTY